MAEQASTLSASEQAHIDSGGESAIVEDTTTPVENTATEQVQTDETAQVEEKQVQKTVPLAALHEERAKAKEMREKVRQLEETTRVGNERLQQLFQAVQRQNAPPAPDKTVDPVAYFDNETQTIKQQLAEQQQFRQQYEQRQQQETQMAQLRHVVSTQESQFLVQNPDYNEALAHMQANSLRGLKSLGYTDEQAQGLAQQEYVKMAHNVAMRQENVAAHIYELAKANGYTAKAPAQDATTKLQAVQKGTAAAKSLGSGGAVVNGLSLQALAAMSSEEFAEATSGKNETAWKKLMGG